MKETVMQFVGNIPYYYHKGSSRRNTHTHKNAASLKGNNRITHTLSQFITWQFFLFKNSSSSSAAIQCALDMLAANL